MRIVIAAAGIAWLGCQAGVAQEAVSVSRYREAKFAAIATQTSALLDMTAFHDRCMDDDGCEVSVFLETVDSIIRADQGRLYVWDTDNQWLSLAGQQNEDGDSTVDLAVFVTAGASTCALTDADTNPSTDGGEGFLLVVNGGTAGAQCNLTVID